MANKNPGFAKNDSPKLDAQEYGEENALADALKKKRKNMAQKRGVSEYSPATDELGNPVTSENDNL